MKDRKKKYTIAVDSSKGILFYNGHFTSFDFSDKYPDEEFELKGFFGFYDERDDDIYWIKDEKIIWVKEIK